MASYFLFSLSLQFKLQTSSDSSLMGFKAVENILIT